jgi:AraC family transcriptional activator of tynA and feaB
VDLPHRKGLQPAGASGFESMQTWHAKAIFARPKKVSFPIEFASKGLSVTAIQTHDAIQYFSTTALPQRQRLDCYMDVLANSMWRVSGWRNLPSDFNVSLSTASLDGLTVVANHISTHHSLRTKADVDNSCERNFHLFLSTVSPWAFTHNGRHERLEVGDVVMFGEGEHETHAPDGFKGVIVKCPEAWINKWVPDAELISGRSLRSDMKWGRVLSPILRALTPEFVTNSPLPPSVIADQLGSVLALLASDLETRVMPEQVEKIREQLRQRCSEAGLTALDIASSLNMPEQDMHRALIASQTMFATELRKARRLCSGRRTSPSL